MATSSEILRWVAGTVLDREPVQGEVPTPVALAEWMRPLPGEVFAIDHDALRESMRALAVVVGEGEAAAGWMFVYAPDPAGKPMTDYAGALQLPDDWPPVIRERIERDFAEGVAIAPRVVPVLQATGPGGSRTLESVHEAWLAIPEAERPRHPLAPLVAAWHERPVEVDMDTRATAIAPQSLFAWAGEAPAILTMPLHDNELPIQPGLIEAETELFIPGLEPPESAVVPAPALVVAEEIGFGSLKPGRGARLDKRLLVYSLLAVPQSERRPGGRYTLRPPLRTITHEWSWPPPASTGSGKSTRSKWKPSRHAPLLARAMNAVTLAGMILPDGREWRPVMFRARPDFGDLDSRAVIEIALPEASERGPLIHRDALIAAGVVSDPAFDGALTLATLWDRAKMANGGRRIHATRPKALRDAQGFLTRADGSRILGHKNDPVTAKDRRLVWRHGNAPQRDWRHPEAVLDGEERHPQADKVPLLNRDDRRRLFYGHASDKQAASARAMAANRADTRLRTLEAEGRVVIEDCGRDGWRILEPRPPTAK